MKNFIALLILPFSLTAMPLQWDCNFPEAKAQTFSVYQGETVTFEPTFRVNGKTVDLDIEGVYIQTNGMAESWWKLDGNTFTPTNDVGAAAYRFFIQAAAGAGGKNYRANGTLRMLPSPGFEPNTLALPIHTLDFSQVEVTNAPWPDGTKVDALAAQKADKTRIVSTVVTVDSFMLPLEAFPVTYTANGEAVVIESNDDLTYVNGPRMTLRKKGETYDFCMFNASFGTFSRLGSGIGSLLFAGRTPDDEWPILLRPGDTYTIAASVGVVYEDALEPLKGAAKDAAEAKETAGSIAALVYGDDCQLIATNYNSATKIPSLMVRFKLKDEATGTNLWYTVYDELRWWNWLTKDYLPDNYYTKAYLDALFEEKADRAWGFYDSHSGNFAPDGYTWISSPKIAIAAGMAYQRILTTSGAIWVLESNGLVTEVGGESDTGFFRISDDKGKALFEITKGSELIAPANAGGCTTRTEMGITHLNIPYFVESSEHPKIQVSRDLKTWFDEGDSACPANVAWSGQSGAYIADVWGKQAEPKLFVQATYKKGAEDKIVNSAPVEFTKLIIGGITYTVAAEEINGKKVLVLK
jgi:hypothetical protein